MSKKLKEVKAKYELSLLPKKCSEGYVEECFARAEEVFNQSPFVGVAWTADDKEISLRKRGDEGDTFAGFYWTKRARKGWTYLDAFFGTINYPGIQHLRAERTEK